MTTEASLFWGLIFGSIGLGFFMYGKRQRGPVPMVCGLVLMIYPVLCRQLVRADRHRRGADGDPVCRETADVARALFAQRCRLNPAAAIAAPM